MSYVGAHMHIHMLTHTDYKNKWNWKNESSLWKMEWEQLSLQE